MTLTGNTPVHILLLLTSPTFHLILVITCVTTPIIFYLVYVQCLWRNKLIYACFISGILNKPCCKISETYGAGQCVPNQPPCPFRSFKPFFDGFHPTETGHFLLAGRSYIGKTPQDAYPYDIRHLASL